MERNQINNETKLSIKTAIYMYAEIQTCDIVSSVWLQPEHSVPAGQIPSKTKNT